MIVKTIPRSTDETATEYADSVGTEKTTYYYQEPRQGLSVTNKGNANLTLTVDGVNYTIAPNKKQNIYDAITSFILVSTSGLQAFEAKAWDNEDKERASKKIVFMGDSITIGDSTIARSYPLWFDAFTKQGHTTINKGVSGNWTADMLTRFDADVVVSNPTHVLINGGKNDISNAVVQSTIQKNLISMVEKALLNGITPILSTVIPYGNRAGGSNTFTAQQQTDTKILNDWIREYAKRSGLQCLDFYKLLATSADWCNDAYVMTDNIHPSKLGMMLLSGEVVPLFEKFKHKPISGTGNLVQNWDFTLDSNSDGLPDSFFMDKAANTTPTYSLVNHPIQGKMLKLALDSTDAATAYGVLRQTLTGWSVGNKLRLSVDVMVTEYATTVLTEAGCSLRFRDLGTGQTAYALHLWPAPFGDIVRLSVDFTVPPGATDLRIEMGFFAITRGACYVGRPEVRIV